MSLSFLFISAKPPTHETGSGKRTVAAMEFLVKAGHSVSLWSPLAKERLLSMSTCDIPIASDSTALQTSYDVAWSMDNWTHKHIAWAANAVDYAKQHLGVKIAVDGACDHLAQAKLHLAKRESNVYEMTVEAERKIWRTVDLILAVSQGVARDMVAAPQGPDANNVLQLPLALEERAQKHTFQVSQRDWAICLPGSLHGLNQQAFIWFITQVWPLIHATKPRLTLRVIGGGTDALAGICAKQTNIELIGRVGDFSQSLSKCLLSVVPAPAPGGVKTVILDSLIAGTPALSAPSSHEHMGLSDGPALMSASTAQDYARKITQFVSNCHANEDHINNHLILSFQQWATQNDFSACMQRIVSRIEQHPKLGTNARNNFYIPDVQTLLIGTYHKTGTVLMKRIFERFAALSGANFVHLNRTTDTKISQLSSATTAKTIMFDYHCGFEGIQGNPQYRGVRVVRDPRMMIISATRYHLDGKEAWLHEPKSEFNGLTYQQQLNSLSSFEEQVIFEMTQKSRAEISDMMAFNKRDIAHLFITVKLEDLMQDESLEVYFSIFRHLGLSGQELVYGLQEAVNNSVFSDKFAANKHMRGSAGETWKDHFTPNILSDYQHLFGNAHQKLGYL